MAGVGVDGRPAAGLQSPHRAPKALCGSCDAREGERIGSRGISRPGRRGDCGDVESVAGWPSGGNGMACSRAKARLNWVSQGQRRGEMQSEAARRAGDPSHQSEDPPPEGLGDHGPLAQTNPRRSSGPGYAPSPGPPASAVGGEARRRHVVSPTPYLRSRMAFSTLGVAAMIGLQFQRLPIAVGDEGVIAVSGEEGELGTGRRLHPPDNEPHRRGVRLGLERV